MICVCFVDSAMQIKDHHPASEGGGQHCSTKSFTRLQIVKNVLVICASVLLLFTAYDGIAMLQSTMNEVQGIGVWSQAIMCLFFSISALFFPKYVIKKFGTKRTYELSMIAYIPYIASNFYSHWALVVPVSILIGLGAALIWGAQASYLNNISIMYVDAIVNSNAKNASEKSISCIYNSINFWSTEKIDNRSVSCDIISFKPYLKNGEGNATFSSYENSWLECDSNAVHDDTSGIEKNFNVSTQQENDKGSKNEQFHSASFGNAEYNNEVESNEKNRCSETNSNAEEVANNKDAAKKRRKLIESTTARLFGFHGVAYLTCIVWGNLMTYFIIMTDIDMSTVSNSSCVCGANYCNVASECIELSTDQPSDRIKNILTGTCICICIIAVLLVFFFLDPLENEKKEEVTFSMDLLMATYKLAKKKELLLLIPASFYIGMVQGFYIGDFTKSFVGCAWGTYHVGLVSVSYGAMCGISSFSSGLLVKLVGRIPVFSVASLVNIPTCATMLIWSPSAEEPTMFFVIAGMWGVHVGAIWSQLRAFYGILFKADEEAAFAAFHVWYSLGFALSFAQANYFCTYAKIYVLIVMYSVMQIKTQHPASEVGGQNCSTRSFTRLQIVKNVFVICAGVLLLFTAYDGMTMLQSTMNREQGIGVWSQAIMYFFFSVSAIFFPKYVIKKFGTKITYAFSMIAYIPYIASNFYSHWALVVPVSILIGLGAALIWGAQASYLNNVSVMYVDIGMNSNGKNAPEKNISCISNNINFWSTEKGDNRSVSCDLTSFKPHLKSDEKNVGLKSLENLGLKRNSIAVIIPKSGMDSSSNFNVQRNKHRASMNDKFYSVPFTDAGYNNLVENSEEKRCVQTNSKAVKIAKGNEGMRKRRKMIESTTARFFGFHGVAYLTCHLWGNLITYFILQTDVDMNAVSNATCVCGADFCNVASKCFEQNIEQPRESIRYVLTGTCVCIAIIAVLAVVFFLDPLESEKKEEVTFSMDLLMATYKLAKKKELILLIPASFYSFVGCAWGTYHVGLVAVSYGAMCGISSFSSGWLVKRVGRIPIFSAASLVNIGACATMLIWRPTAEEPAMFFVIAGMWGVHVGAIWSQLRAFYGILFKADEEAAFAAFHVWSPSRGADHLFEESFYPPELPHAPHKGRKRDVTDADCYENVDLDKGADVVAVTERQSETQGIPDVKSRKGRLFVCFEKDAIEC
ncbi:unnamed protein product [Larinioides sclopetarius]|uniref:UNC93-like protein n=1 Tax=Larinioides sclopetarius TaxID=280406 RepID=A0AAV2B925_9ARAC